MIFAKNLVVYENKHKSVYLTEEGSQRAQELIPVLEKALGGISQERISLMLNYGKTRKS